MISDICHWKKNIFLSFLFLFFTKEAMAISACLIEVRNQAFSFTQGERVMFNMEGRDTAFQKGDVVVLEVLEVNKTPQAENKAELGGVFEVNVEARVSQLSRVENGFSGLQKGDQILYVIGGGSHLGRTTIGTVRSQSETSSWVMLGDRISRVDPPRIPPKDVVGRVEKVSETEPPLGQEVLYVARGEATVKSGRLVESEYGEAVIEGASKKIPFDQVWQLLEN